MSYIASENILDEPIPTSFKSSTMNPTPVGFALQKLKQFGNWIISYVPEPIKRTASDKLRTLKETISKIFYDGDKTPKEIESALKGTTKTFRIKGTSSGDYKTYLKDITPEVIALLGRQPKPLKVMLRMQCQFRKTEAEAGEVFTDYHFNTKNNIVDESTNLTDFLSVSVERLIELIESLQGRGSGWIFDEVLHFDILTNVYKPLAGSSYIPLPKFLASKKALINPKNTDQECFKWAVTEAVYPQKRDRNRITKTSKENAELFNWDGIKFPMKLSQINLFEKNNPTYVVNVLGYSKDDGIYPVRISKQYTSIAGEVVINLMLLSGESEGDTVPEGRDSVVGDGEVRSGSHQHYALINNMSRLVGMQTNKHNGKTHICLNCFNTFSLEKSFKDHAEVCLSNESVKIEMPKKGSCIEFDKHAKKLRVPFVIYADFESYTERLTENVNTDDQQSYPEDATKSYTKKYQKHTPSGFCYYIVYRGGIYKKPVVYSPA